MRGEKVVVRAAGDEPLVRTIWDATDDLVYICSDESYARILNDGPQPDCFPVGFPRQYVFKYDEHLVQELAGRTRVSPTTWKRLTIWSAHDTKERRKK